VWDPFETTPGISRLILKCQKEYKEISSLSVYFDDSRLANNIQFYAWVKIYVFAP